MFPGSGRVLGIQVDNNYISLPGELFENFNESGIKNDERHMYTYKLELFRACGIFLF